MHASNRGSNRALTPPTQPIMASQTPRSAKEIIAHGMELKSSIKWLQFANKELEVQVNQFIKALLTCFNYRSGIF